MKKFVDKRSLETGHEKDWAKLRSEYLKSVDSLSVADSPILYMDRRLFAQTIAKIKLFEISKNVQGSIIECGVHRGNSLMLFMHLCSVFSPMSFNKKIIGFDTFEGFADISPLDPPGINPGDMGDVDFELLSSWIEMQQKNNTIPHVPRIELVRGLAEETIPTYIEKNPHLLVSFLYMDFDLYAPTLLALQQIFPLMPKGSVIAFDQLNQRKWHGETLAIKEFFSINNLKLQVFDFEPHISYAVVGE
jgi:Macrocin-O-methyltransferase (TylF)